VPADCYFFQRELDSKRFLVALNISRKKRQFSLNLLPGEPRLLLSTIAERQAGAVKEELLLDPLEGAVLQY